MKDDLAYRVRQTLVAHDLLRGGERVVVGVSAGPDSVALLHILVSLGKIMALEVIAVYVDHGLRPEEAVGERKYIGSLAERLGIGHEIITVDVRGRARTRKQSLEHAARDLRYDALRQTARRHAASVIAVAHTADDQAEEILIRLLRGASGLGLSGMQYKNRDIIRPLLDVSKQRLLEYLAHHHLAYCHDSSNMDAKFLRNRVRHQLLPFLESHFDAGVKKALRKSASILADDEALLADLTEQAWQRVVSLGRDLHGPLAVLDRREFCALPRALRRRLVERLLWSLESRASYEHIMKVVESADHGMSGGELHLQQGLRVAIERESLRFSYPRGRGAWRGRLRDKADG